MNEELKQIPATNLREFHEKIASYNFPLANKLNVCGTPAKSHLDGDFSTSLPQSLPP